jgi:hypothetical protein
MHYNTVCLPDLPCHNFRNCDRCARLRQAKIAELASSKHAGGAITYAVITGLSASSIPAAKQLPCAYGGLFSVEIGAQFRGLHLNLILEAQSSLTADHIATTLSPLHCSIWSAPITTEDLPHVAAYINKREAIPNHREWPGRAYGTFGTWRSAKSIIQTQRLSPIASAAMHEAELRAFALAPDTPAPDMKTPADFREIAARHLPALRHLMKDRCG